MRQHLEWRSVRMVESRAHVGEVRQKDSFHVRSTGIGASDPASPHPIVVSLPLRDVEHVPSSSGELGLDEGMSVAIGVQRLAVATNHAAIVGPDDECPALPSANLKDDVKPAHVAAHRVRRMSDANPKKLSPINGATGL